MVNTKHNSPRFQNLTYARAGEDFADEDQELKEQLFKENVDVLPLTNISRILDPGDACVALGRKFGLNEMQLESLEDGRYGGVNPSNTFIDTLIYAKQDTELSELAGVFEDLQMGKASEALQTIIARPGNKKEKIGDLTPFDFSLFYGKLRGGLSTQTNWKDVADALEMQNLIPTIESSRRQGYNYSITSSLMNTLSAQAKTVGEFVNVMNAVNIDETGSLNSAVMQLDKDLKRSIQWRKKKLEKEKRRTRKLSEEIYR